jgi:tRNA(fMet)-specific endonuclease VapC
MIYLLDSNAYIFLNRFISLPFDDRAAEVYGRIRARLSAIGTPNGPNDLFISLHRHCQ